MKIFTEIIKRAIPLLLFGIVIFLAAGRIDYWQGWALLAVVMVMNFVTISAKGVDQELVKERSAPGKGRKSWDKIIIGLAFPVYIITLLVASLDTGRFHWTHKTSWIFSVLGVLLNLIGLGIFEAAKRQNRFFSTVVRIQTDRSHQVIEKGLYGVIRHPGYLGTVISTIGLPMIFSSLWAGLPALVYLALFIIRTKLEDDLLTSELEEYSEYKAKVKYRLVPFLW